MDGQVWAEGLNGLAHRSPFKPRDYKLFTGPGSQNGYDNSGRRGEIRWASGDYPLERANIDRCLLFASPQPTLTQQQNPRHPGHGLCLTLLLDLRRPVQPLHPLRYWYPQRAAHLRAMVRRAILWACLHARLLSEGLRRCQKIF